MGRRWRGHDFRTRRCRSSSDAILLLVIPRGLDNFQHPPHILQRSGDRIFVPFDFLELFFGKVEVIGGVERIFKVPLFVKSLDPVLSGLNSLLPLDEVRFHLPGPFDEYFVLL
jgi:hypothetical protein